MHVYACRHTSYVHMYSSCIHEAHAHKRMQSVHVHVRASACLSLITKCHEPKSNPASGCTKTQRTSLKAASGQSQAWLPCKSNAPHYELPRHMHHEKVVLSSFDHPLGVWCINTHACMDAYIMHSFPKKHQTHCRSFVHAFMNYTLTPGILHGIHTQ
jgi:hypothetical protein